jgi:hypothetical protein
VDNDLKYEYDDSLLIVLDTVRFSTIDFGFFYLIIKGLFYSFSIVSDKTNLLAKKDIIANVRKAKGVKQSLMYYIIQW